MLLTLHRYAFDGDSTIGRLSIDGAFEAYTLEDVLRTDGIKVPGATAIPAGHYEVVIDYSNRFKRLMPHVLNVPAFEGIRIHSGNRSIDTAGCLLLGQTTGKDFIGHSKDAFNIFFAKLEEGLKIGKCYIDIINGA